MPPAALITGASSGIGRAAALRLESEGWTVFAGVRDPAAGDDLIEAATGAGVLVPVRLDVTDQGSIDAARSEIAERVGADGLGGLVNNAGVGSGGPLEYLPLDYLREVLEVNTIGQVAVTQAMLPLLRRGGGRIVFTSSDNGRWAPPYMGPYAASKFALEAIGDTFRLELRRSKIPVSIIEPGSIRTSIWDKGIDGIAAGEMKLGPDSSEHYGDVTTLMRNVMEEGNANGIPPERVADAIHHALIARRPKTRYRIGRDARMMIMLKSVLPDRVFDAAVSRIIRRFEKG